MRPAKWHGRASWEAAFHPTLPQVISIIVSDVASRDVGAGTTAIVRSISRLRENYVWWKFGSACLFGFLLCAAPLTRTIPHGLLAFAALICGIVFVASIATALGVTTANPKTFIVGFLTFWYVVVNDRGGNPMLDFAGFYGRFTATTIVVYALISVFAVGMAQLFYRARLART